MSEVRNWDLPITLTTGGEEELQIIALRDEFFKDVSKKLGFASLSIEQNPFIEVKTSDLGNETPSGFTYSDDRIHQMIVCNELLASVFDRRDEVNYHEITFWSRDPGPMCAEQITRVAEIM